MQLEYSFLADAVQVSAGTGRYFVFNGGVESVLAPGFPGLLATLAYLGRIRILPAEHDMAHSLQLRCLRPNGEPLVPTMESSFDPRTVKAPHNRPVYHLFVVNYSLIQLHEYGEHRFILACDGEDLGSISFFVDPMPQDPAQPIATRGAEHEKS